MGFFSNLFSKEGNKEPQWDKFKAFQMIRKEPLMFGKPIEFVPSKYQIWSKGRVINEGVTTEPIKAVVFDDGSPSKQFKVTILDRHLHGEILGNIYYDEFVTSNDRLQMLTLPQTTNTGNTAISLLKMAIGATRSAKEFASNEPFCCNLFILNNVLSKVTFSFSSPDKLIEFY
jgi:hypothetical protein